MSGARQSEGAHRLWLGLARDYELGYVDLRRKRLSYWAARWTRPCWAICTRAWSCWAGAGPWAAHAGDGHDLVEGARTQQDLG